VSLAGRRPPARTFLPAQHHERAIFSLDSWSTRVARARTIGARGSIMSRSRISIAAACVASAAALIFASSTAAASNKLWLAFDSGTASCKDNTTNFFTCLLGSTNFNTLALGYPAGESLTVGGSATLTTSCASTDFQCVVDNAGFTPAPYDVVVHYYGSSWMGGTNGTRTLTVGGKSVIVNVAWVQTGASCNGQTCTGAHEVYEAATDGVSADCCNGQTPPFCPKCHTDCGVYAGSSSKYCYPLTCGGATYQMQLISPYGNEFDSSSCTKLSITGPTCGALHDACAAPADCCSGLTCKAWSLSGSPPYDDHCCGDLGTACTRDTDCCGGSNCDTSTHKCACVPKDGWCINADECCSGSSCDLTAHKCVAGVSDAGPPADAGHDATTSDTAPSDGGVVDDASFDAPTHDGADGQGGGDDGKGGCSCRVGPGAGAHDVSAIVLGAPLALAAAFARRRRLRLRR
jgi:MYXO-CTERM domain-containing protein